MDGVAYTTPYIQYDGDWKRTAGLTVRSGSEITFGPHPMDGEWTWTRPDGSTANGRELKATINDNTAGVYTATYRNGGTVIQQKFYISVLNCPNITPYVQYEGEWKQVSELSVKPGSEITFGPQPLDNNGWTWTLPNGKTVNTREVTVTVDQPGTYTAAYETTEGCYVEQEFKINLESSTGVNAVKSAAPAGDRWTDLQGRRVNPKNAPEGIYLHNDKKVLK